MAKGIIIRTNGTIENVVIESLADMQAAVGGYIERACSFDGSDMWVNEEGLLRGMEANLKALVIRDRALVGSFHHMTPLVGDALILGSENGENADVTDAARRTVEEA